MNDEKWNWMTAKDKNRRWYITALDMWLDHFKVVLHPKNYDEIAATEREFNHYWVAAGHTVPDNYSKAIQYWMNY